MAEHLLGGGVVQAVALAAHGLADAEAFELAPPPLVLVLPSHVRVQDGLRAGGQALREHGEQALLLPEVRTAAHVPGDDLLAGHVVHGSEVRLGAGDLELGDVGAELGERTGRVEVAFEQVMHVIARLAPVRVVPPPRVPGADGASQSHAPHDPGHALGRHSLPELVDQAHAHLPVAAPVRRAPARASVRASVWISSLWACPWASARAPPDLRPGTRGTSVPGVRRSRSRAWP